MRKLIVMMMLINFVISLCGCDGAGLSDKEAFIPGTYRRAINGTYSQGMDELVIERLPANHSSYLIQHNSQYTRRLNGKWLKVETKTENWLAVYDNESENLKEQGKGKLFVFIPEKNQCLMGTLIYSKVKP